MKLILPKNIVAVTCFGGVAGRGFACTEQGLYL
jgi:hypothetical protein